MLSFCCSILFLMARLAAIFSSDFLAVYWGLSFELVSYLLAEIFSNFSDYSRDFLLRLVFKISSDFLLNTLPDRVLDISKSTVGSRVASKLRSDTSRMEPVEFTSIS